MAPKGKQGTKGQKQIIEDNQSTLGFYFKVITGVNVGYLLVQFLLFWESYSTLFITLSCLALVVYTTAYQFLKFMAGPTYGNIDLNMEAGMAEHAKDIILLTAIVQVLSLCWNYFWLLWLLAPFRALYLLWVNILAPWIFAEPPEVDEKKQKKAERRMRRH